MTSESKLLFENMSLRQMCDSDLVGSGPASITLTYIHDMSDPGLNPGIIISKGTSVQFSGLFRALEGVTVATSAEVIISDALSHTRNYFWCESITEDGQRGQNVSIASNDEDIAALYLEIEDLAGEIGGYGEAITLLNGAVSSLAGTVAGLEEDFGDLILEHGRVTGIVTVLQNPTQAFEPAEDGVSAIVGNTGYYRVLGLGTARGAVYTLPDATTVPNVGQAFEIINSTAEFLGVQNTDASFRVRVAPLSSARFVCLSKATAPGSWLELAGKGGLPRRGIDVTEEFLGEVALNSYVGAVELHGYISGGTLQALAIPSGPRCGAIQLSTGIGTTGYCVAVSASGGTFRVGGGAIAITVSQALSEISTPTQSYISRVGMHDGVNGSNPANGLFFVCARENFGNDNWHLQGVNNSAPPETIIDTGIAPTYSSGSNWQRLRIEVSSNANRVDGYINGVKVSPTGGLTTDIPIGYAIRPVCVGVSKSAGTSPRLQSVEYLRIESYPTTDR